MVELLDTIVVLLILTGYVKFVNYLNLFDSIKFLLYFPAILFVALYINQLISQYDNE